MEISCVNEKLQKGYWFQTFQFQSQVSGNSFFFFRLSTKRFHILWHFENSNHKRLSFNSIHDDDDYPRWSLSTHMQHAFETEVSPNDLILAVFIFFLLTHSIYLLYLKTKTKTTLYYLCLYLTELNFNQTTKTIKSVIRL